MASLPRAWTMAPLCASYCRYCQVSRFSVTPIGPFPRQYSSSAERLPRVAQPSFWKSMVPKFMRSSDHSTSKTGVRSKKPKGWNPATFFIWIFLLIGSNGIQMITLRNEYTVFSRKSDAKIALLKDVLERVQRGEHVDVEKLLGTGDEQQEQEWKDVLRDIEQEDSLWQSKVKRKEKQQARKGTGEASPKSSPASTAVSDDDVGEPDPMPSKGRRRPPGFY